MCTPVFCAAPLACRADSTARVLNSSGRQCTEVHEIQNELKVSVKVVAESTGGAKSHKDHAFHSNHNWFPTEREMALKELYQTYPFFLTLLACIGQPHTYTENDDLEGKEKTG